MTCQKLSCTSHIHPCVLPFKRLHPGLPLHHQIPCYDTNNQISCSLPYTQAALRDPTLADRINEEARLAVVAASSARLHAHRLGLRQRRAEALQARVARGGAEAGELAVAEVAAGTAYQVGVDERC